MTELETWAARMKATLHARSQGDAGAHPPDIYTVFGPTTRSQNLLIMEGETCVATVKLNPEHPDDSRRTAQRLARIANRTAILQHLLGLLEHDEQSHARGWTEEVQMIREELARTEDA